MESWHHLQKSLMFLVHQYPQLYSYLVENSPEYPTASSVGSLESNGQCVSALQLKISISTPLPAVFFHMYMVLRLAIINNSVLQSHNWCLPNQYAYDSSISPVGLLFWCDVTSVAIMTVRMILKRSLHFDDAIQRIPFHPCIPPHHHLYWRQYSCHKTNHHFIKCRNFENEHSGHDIRQSSMIPRSQCDIQ